MIVKVQRPLVSSEPRPPVLVYNRDRSVLVRFPLDDVLRRAMGRDLKQYWLARLDNGTLRLLRRAPEQEW